MEIVKELITPAIAKKYLTFNIDNNRNINISRVAAYAEDIKKGLWITDTGDCVRFNTKGQLIDGQHRLSAVVRANISVELYVAYDVPEEAVTVIDTGKTRTFSDTLRIEGSYPSYIRAAAIVTWVYRYKQGYPTNKGIAVTPPQLLEEFNNNSELYIEAARRSYDLTRARLATSSAGGVAYCLFNAISPSYTHVFFDSLVSGANLNKKSPILILRNRLVQVGKDRIKSYEVLAMFVRAWNNYIIDNPVSSIYYNGTDKRPLNNYNFPEIKVPK